MAPSLASQAKLAFAPCTQDPRVKRTLPKPVAATKATRSKSYYEHHNRRGNGTCLHATSGRAAVSGRGGLRQVVVPQASLDGPAELATSEASAGVEASASPGSTKPGPTAGSSSAPQSKGQPAAVEPAVDEAALKAADVAAAAAACERPAAEVIAEHGTTAGVFFCSPLQLVSGGQARLFFNRAYSCMDGFARQEVNMSAGYNGWDTTFQANMEPVAGVEGEDWWVASFSVPDTAATMQFVFSNGGDSYDNNGGSDYTMELLHAPDLDVVRAEEAARRQKEADMNAAREYVDALRGAAAHHSASGTASWDSPEGTPIWATAAPLKAGGSATVLYNAGATPLSGSAEVVLLAGANAWGLLLDPVPMEPCPKRGPGWWQATVQLPRTCFVLDFVTRNGDETVFDNNGGQDYHAQVEAKVTTDAEWDELVLERYGEIVAERAAAERAAAERAAAKLARRKAAREGALEVQRRQLRHVLYTQPAPLQAGKDVTVFYNPKNTGLHWCDTVHLRGGFNRWTHAEAVNVKMEHVQDDPDHPDHLQATITLPEDAHMIDMVFASAHDDGDHVQYDNSFGLDYHLPINGASTEPQPLHIIHVSVEMAPIAKVGGLGDVVTSLSRAVQEMGHHVEVVMPYYSFLNHSPLLQNPVYDCSFEWGGCSHHVHWATVEDVRVFFIRSENGMFDGDSVYTGRGDGPRFDFFSKAALEWMLQSARQPDIIHTHDWSTALTAQHYWNDYHHNGLWKPRMVFTIHNLDFGEAEIGQALYHSQMATTVSPTYAAEVSGHPAVSGHLGKFCGVLNGIDPDIWGPEEDPFLARQYGAEDVAAGKRANQEALRQRLGLTGWGDKPLVGVVSRLTAQKGIHLISHAAHHTLGRGAQFVLLGSAPDPKVQGEFNALGASLQGPDAAFYFAYDEPLSHLIYAACDVILVPSMFEPCGLTQLIAMRYGAVPVVRQTGGLRDTVFDVDHDQARAAWDMHGSADPQADGVDGTNGFSFEGTEPEGLNYALDRCLDAYYNDRDWFRGLQRRVMLQDWSWNRPALKYVELYYQAMKN